MTEAFKEIYTQHDIRVPDGTNLLTERLKAEGYDPADSSTWPENVYSEDGEHFLFRWDWKFSKVWEAPCGLQTRGNGQWWGEVHAEGQYFCDENDNPLFGCPYPSKPCPHRKANFPGGINCQFHQVPAESYDESREIREIEKARIDKLATVTERDQREHPGYKQRCGGMKMDVDPDGTEHVRYQWRMIQCGNCLNTVCPARGWAPRDTRKANIFYDVYIERIEDEGLIPIVKKTLLKGLQVFDKPVAWTDAEMAIRIWEKDPESVVLPMGMCYRLRNFDAPGLKRTEEYFIRHHGQYDGKHYRIHTELRNMRVAKMDQKDMLADLQAIRDGIEVIHDSDTRKAAQARKTDRRRAAEIEKQAKLLAKGANPQIIRMGYTVNRTDSDRVRKRKEETWEAIRARAEELKKQSERKERRKAEAGEQISFLDVMDKMPKEGKIGNS